MKKSEKEKKRTSKVEEFGEREIGSQIRLEGMIS